MAKTLTFIIEQKYTKKITYFCSKIFFMRKYWIPFLASLLLFSLIGFSPTDCIPEKGKTSCNMPPEKINFQDCTYKGFKLNGKIKFVESFPDIKVKIVDNFPDLKVKMVENFPDECGEWQAVDNFPNLKVQIVENFPDLKIKYVENFPGKP